MRRELYPSVLHIWSGILFPSFSSFHSIPPSGQRHSGRNQRLRIIWPPPPLRLLRERMRRTTICKYSRRNVQPRLDFGLWRELKGKMRFKSGSRVGDGRGFNFACARAISYNLRYFNLRLQTRPGTCSVSNLVCPCRVKPRTIAPPPPPEAN